MAKKEKPVIKYEQVRNMAEDLRDDELTYAGTYHPLSFDDAKAKLAQKKMVPREEVLREKIRLVKGELDHNRKEQAKSGRETTKKKVEEFAENPNKTVLDAKLRIKVLENELGVLAMLHDKKGEQHEDYQNRTISLSQAEFNHMVQLEDEMEEIERKMQALEHRIANEAKIEKSALVGLDKLAHPVKPHTIDNLYDKHVQTTTINKRFLDNEGEKLSYTFKTGKQRTAKKISDEGKLIPAVAKKSEARLNFENTLIKVGELKTAYEEAYEKHFAGNHSTLLSRFHIGKFFKKTPEERNKAYLRWNHMLEGMGIRLADKVGGLKEEREAYEKAKASLLDNLKSDLIEKRGFAHDQAERVAKKYVEKVLTIENITREEARLVLLKEKTFEETKKGNDRIAKEMEKARGLKKVGLYLKKNWEYRTAMTAIGLTTSLLGGGTAAAYLLRKVAGIAGGFIGGKFGGKAGQFIGKRLYGKESKLGKKKIEHITEEYVQGKISITEYQKRLSQMGLNESLVRTICAVAGGAAAGYEVAHLETEAQDFVENQVRETIDGIQKLRSLGGYHGDTTLSPEEIREMDKLIDSVKADAAHEGAMDQATVDKMLQEMEHNKQMPFHHETTTDHQTSESVSGEKEISTDGKEVESTKTGANTVPETATAPSGHMFESVAQKGDGGIRMTERLQAELRAQYPDIDHAPQAVQDFVHADPEKLMVDEKILVYKDGVASSGIMQPGDRLVFDADTGKLELISAKGTLVSTLEDGNAATAETYTGPMQEDHVASSVSHSVTIDRDDTPVTWDNGVDEQATDPGSSAPSAVAEQAKETPAATSTQEQTIDQATQQTSNESTTTIERDEEGNPVNEMPAQEKINAAQVFDEHAILKVDTTGYDPDVIAMAELYAKDLPETGQADFLAEYDSAIKSIFSTNGAGEHISNVYESPSLWDTYKEQSYATIMQTLEHRLSMNPFEKRLYAYLHEGSSVKKEILNSIATSAPNIRLEDLIAVIEKNS